MSSKKTTCLIILDGWGHRENREHNAIAQANTPNWDYFNNHYPHTLISGSGLDVGLPDQQMGNSEVGHLNIGAGRKVRQDFSRIGHSIETGDFFKNPVLINLLDTLNANQKTLHIFGLLSPGGVHSHEDHLLAMLELAKQKNIKQCFIHAFLDGRDTPPKSAKASLEKLQNKIKQLNFGRIVSLCGRYYPMDRDKRWDRVQLAYDLITNGQADYHAKTALDALEQAYQRGETDEFVKPTVIYNDNKPSMNNGDAIVFINFRADRARELSYAFTEKNFNEFERAIKPELSDFVCLTQYADDIKAHVAYPPEKHRNVLSDVLAQHGLTQLHIAETEKYAHVTFFFNGGREQPFKDEERILIPSPNVATYDLQPEMNAPLLTEKLIAAIKQQTFDVVICNFANADMVGHTGNFAATKIAIETLDTCLGKIYQALKPLNGEMLITADHGNAECMYNPDNQQPHTAHTNLPVPLVYIGRPAKFINQHGVLADIAPTLLSLLNIKQPEEMTGCNLLNLELAVSD